MSTPTYLGKGQPLTSGGLLGKLGSYFGNGGTPAYIGEGQSSAVSRGGLLAGAATPPYAAARPAIAARDSQEPASTCESTCVTECAAEAPAPMMCPIDPEALAAGQIAIVIPRQGS